MPYTLNFTDTTKNPITVEDSQLNTQTSLEFVGKNYPGYARSIGENFLHLLENFAGTAQPLPTKSVVGQIWYDSNNNQLKVFDGQTYGPAGNVFKSFTPPTNKKVGDIWVDLTNKQLFFWSGASWILIGPQFSQGSDSGPVIETIKDTLNIDRIIIRFVVGGETVIILTKNKFTPKITIDGFVELNPGINLSSKAFAESGGVSNKFWGTAEKASALLVGNFTVESTKFLRSDIAGATDYRFTIRSDEGLTLGSNSNISFASNSGGELVIYNNTDGANTIFRTYVNPNAVDLLTLKGTRIGVNNINPLETLDVVGSGKFSQSVKILGSTDLASNTTVTNLTGALIVAGGTSIAKKLFVGSQTTLNDTTTSKTIIPGANSIYNLGDTNKAYGRVYADVVGNNAGTTQFIGNFTGVYTGSISGSATQLANTTTFNISGDIRTTSDGSILFDGATGGTQKTFTVEIDPSFLNDKETITGNTALPTDTFLVIQNGLVKKTTRNLLFSRIAVVPVGTIVSYAGISPPNGYLFCDGAEVLRANYPELYDIIGGLYNVGTLLGVGTFKLPDLRGRFALGRDTMYNGIQVPQNTVSLTGFSGVIQESVSSPTTTTITGINSTTGLFAGMLLSKVSGLGSFGGITTIVAVNSSTQITINGASPYTVGSINFTATQVTQLVATPSLVDRVSNSAADNLGGSGGNESLVNISSGTIVTGGTTPASTGVSSNVMNPYLVINYIIFTGRYQE